MTNRPSSGTPDTQESEKSDDVSMVENRKIRHDDQIVQIDGVQVQSIQHRASQ
jgi:hypothetical protein